MERLKFINVFMLKMHLAGKIEIVVVTGNKPTFQFFWASVMVIRGG